MLYQLSYISAAAPRFDLTKMPELLHKSRLNNQKVGLTGMLLYANGTFLQVLEGREAAITDRFDAIEQDTRHCWIVRLRYEAIEQRVFRKWSMLWHACRPNDEIAGLIRNIASAEQLGEITDGKSPDLDRLLTTFAHRKFNVAA